MNVITYYAKCVLLCASRNQGFAFSLSQLSQAITLVITEGCPLNLWRERVLTLENFAALLACIVERILGLHDIL